MPVNAVDSRGLSALHYAILQRNWNLIYLILGAYKLKWFSSGLLSSGNSSQFPRPCTCGTRELAQRFLSSVDFGNVHKSRVALLIASPERSHLSVIVWGSRREAGAHRR